MSKKKTFWITLIVASVCIILLLSLFIFILSTVNPRVKMQGYVVSYDGTVKEEISFSIRTKQVRGAQKGEKALELTFDLPEDFPYRLDSLTSISSPNGKVSYYVFAGYCTNVATGASSFMYCAYDKDTSTLFIDWNDGGTDYFIATGSSDKTTQEIWAYFKSFRESIPKTK